MEEEAALKMTALKAAYAEVILNASKEAAARVLTADRKALRTEHELFAFKEESLRMLLRLKQMLDSKTAEAELRQRSQQGKIEELEAQLSEAEGIIIDLREELRQVQDELERTKYNQFAHLSKHSMHKEEATMMNTSEDNEDRQPSLNSQNIAGIDDERYCSTYFSVSEDPTRDAQMTPSQNQVVGPHPEEPSSEQNNAKEPCTSSSSDLDENDGKIAREPQTENVDDSKCSSPFIRAGCRRPRNNMKYQEAIAALRPRAKSSFVPSIYRCSTSLIGKDAKLEANGSHPSLISDDSALSDERIPDHDAAHDATPVKVILEKDHHGDDGEVEASSSKCHVDQLLVDDDKLNSIDDSEGTKEWTSLQVDENINEKKQLQRKRKKEALATLDDNIVPEMNGVKRRVVGGKGDISSMNKSILKDETPKDSKQLLQIAQQLVSLAGDWQ